ncbi:MAG: hypothetical protein IBX55_13030 [Methyloprofundus sp.]|nr:hypothetical protein [Methyloprofundus sp.]
MAYNKKNKETEFARMQDMLSLSHLELANQIGMSETSMIKYRSGYNKVPEYVLMAMRGVLLHDKIMRLLASDDAKLEDVRFLNNEYIRGY